MEHEYSNHLSPEISERIVSTIRGYFESDPVNIFLYGSYAKGTFKTESDIDLYILMPTDQAHRLTRKYEWLDKELTVATGKECHAVIGTMINGWSNVKLY